MSLTTPAAPGADTLAAWPRAAQRPLTVLLALALGLLLVWAVALASGSSEVPLADLPRLLLWPDDSVAAEIVHRLRLPRAMAAISTGALLALAGALMQILLRNPLADPYVLGLSGGAALGAVGAMALGCGLLLVHLGAFGGALLAVLLVFGLARQDLARLDAASSEDRAPRLLLTGVMLSSLTAAGISLVLTLAPGDELRGMLFWMLGDLSGAEAHAPVLLAPVVFCALLLPFGRDLNLLLRGPGPAQMLGVSVARCRLGVFAVASAAAALAVATAGTVGFVGLVVPHLLRLVLGQDQRLLLPASALVGGAFLLAADTLARTLVAPQQLPVGAITALVGAPTFILLLLRAPRGVAGAGPTGPQSGPAHAPAPPEPPLEPAPHEPAAPPDALAPADPTRSHTCFAAAPIAPPGDAAPVLQACALRVAVGPRVLVACLDFCVRPGEFWCLLGPNGAGKTQLLLSLAGARPVQGGQVRVAGRALSDWPLAALARQRGLVPQSLHDAFATPVLDVVLQGRHPHVSRWHWEGQDDVALAQAALARVGLAGLGGRDVCSLSGGERQRVALATLLAQDPPLALLDEPLAHLDLAQQQRVLAMLTAQAREQGRALLMSVHDLSLAQRVATHALLLAGDGSAVAGTVAEVMTAEHLSAAFGHPLHRHRARGQTWWLPG